MSNGITTGSLLRLVGFMAIGVGAAWVLQVLGLGGSTGFGRVMWVVAAAAIAGGGAGLIFTSSAVSETDKAANA